MAEQSRFGFKKGERPKDLRAAEMALEGLQAIIHGYGEALEAVKPNADLSPEKIQERADTFLAGTMAGFDLMLLICVELNHAFQVAATDPSPWREVFPKVKSIAELAWAAAQSEVMGAPNLAARGRTKAVALVQDVGQMLTELHREIAAMLNGPRPVA